MMPLGVISYKEFHSVGSFVAGIHEHFLLDSACRRTGHFSAVDDNPAVYIVGFKQSGIISCVVDRDGQ